MPHLNDQLLDWIAENHPQVAAEAWAAVGEEPPTGPPGGRPDDIPVPPGIVLSDPNRPRNYRDYVGREDEIPPPPAYKAL